MKRRKSERKKAKKKLQGNLVKFSFLVIKRIARHPMKISETFFIFFGGGVEVRKSLWDNGYYTVSGITRSVSALCWEGDRFDARPKPRHS